MEASSVEPALNQFILKVAARCNLNCSYCYVYNKADTGWKRRPAVMSDETFDTTIARIRRHCQRTGLGTVLLLFHGGEPTLIGAERFELLCQRARAGLEDVAEVALAVQTNGTLLDSPWIEVFEREEVQVGVSMDGPADLHDRFRVDHRGRGSYSAVARGVALLRDAGMPFSILSVIQLGADPLHIHHHFLELGCTSISYLLPAYDHDDIAPILERFGSTPCADFLIPIFDDWWSTSTIDLRIREFWNIGRVVMGGDSELDSIGNPPLRFVAIETDGAIEGLDKLRICEDGMTETGLNVHGADFLDIERASALHGLAMRGMPLPTACAACPERTTCAGGYLPHRYSKSRQFDNPSVWCADLLRLFGHIRGRMRVTPAQTLANRRRLRRWHARRTQADTPARDARA